jgi:hypothetical protein
LKRTTILALTLAAVLLAGCGGSGGGTTSAGTGSTTAKEPFHDLPGIRGEGRGEQATSLHISRHDCETLRNRAERLTRTALRESRDPTPPNSRCRLTGPGVGLSVFLDSGRSAHRRYLNRMEEQNQFAEAKPGKLVHPVPDVGDPVYGETNANWVPDLGTLFASRGNRWLTVTISARDLPGTAARDAAAELAHLGFRLTAGEG